MELVAEKPAVEVVTIPIPPDKYWELRFRLAEHNRVLRQCEQTVAESKAVVDAVAVSAGLTIGQGYRLDDATLTATLTGS